jgi:tetratricopeptide (TPR) repeat protein
MTAVFRARRTLVELTRDKAIAADRTQRTAQLNEPQRWLADAAKQRPYWPLIPRLLSQIAELQGQRDQAVTHMERAHELGDDSETVVLSLLAYYRAQAQSNNLVARRAFLDKADQLLTGVSRRSSFLLSGAVGRVAQDVHWMQGRFDEAIGIVQDISESSKNPADRILLATRRLEALLRNHDLSIEQRKQELAEIESLFKDATALDPKLPKAWIALVNYYVQTNRAAEAEQTVQDAVLNVPDEPPHIKPLTIGACHEAFAALQGLTTEEATRHRDAALVEYNRALDTAPDNPVLQMEVARFHARSGRPDEAIKLLEQILNGNATLSDSDRAQVRLTLALANASKGLRADSEAALRLLKDAKWPDEQWIIRGLRAEAEILDRRNGPGDAKSLRITLEEIAKRETLAPKERFLLGALYDRVDGDWDKARAQYESLLRDFPSDGTVLAVIVNGMLRRSTENEKGLAEARDYFDRLALGEPNVYRTKAIETRLMAAEGSAEQAAAMLSEFVRTQAVERPAQELINQLDEQHLAEVIDHLAEVAEKQKDDMAIRLLKEIRKMVSDGKPQEAITNLRSLGEAQYLVAELRNELLNNAALVIEQIDQAPLAEGLYRDYAARSSRPDAILSLVGYLARQDRHEEGFAICEERWPDLPPLAVAGAAVALVRDGTMDDAHANTVITRIEEAISAAKSAEQIELLRLLADVRDFQGKYIDAQQVYSRILDLKPDHLIALNNLAWLLARTGHADMGLAFIETAINKSGPYAELLDTKGVVLLEAGRAAEAVAVLTQASNERPMSDVYFHLAEAQWRNHDIVAARTTLATAEDAGLDPEKLHPLDRAQYDKLAAAVAKR